jgi:hypothetical protein
MFGSSKTISFLVLFHLGWRECERRVFIDCVGDFLKTFDKILKFLGEILTDLRFRKKRKFQKTLEYFGNTSKVSENISEPQRLYKNFRKFYKYTKKFQKKSKLIKFQKY